MKKTFLILTGLILFVALSSCAHMVGADTQVEIEKHRPIKEAIADLQADDPRQARVLLLTWQIKYYQENLRAIELEYTGLCYKDQRHRKSSAEIERLTQKIRRLLLGG